MTYSHIVTSNYVSIMNLETGEVTKFNKTDPAYEKAVEFVKVGDFDSAVKLSVKNVLTQTVVPQSTGDFAVRIVGGVVKYSFKGQPEKELHNVMTDRVVKMIGEGFNATPFINFMANLLSNPSKTAVDELYLFLEATGLPITDDGHFIAYKIVRDDYTSHYDRKFKNEVGTVVEMPRNEVCDNRDQTCSHGLHFCSKEYLVHYGSTATNDDRLVLVKINPADVVSIPSDYNNAKGRASKYLIWKDITEKDWRAKYCKQDYNTSSVELGDWDDEDWYDEDADEDGWYDAESEGVPRCPECGTYHVHKRGWNYVGDKRRYQCQECSHNFYKDATR